MNNDKVKNIGPSVSRSTNLREARRTSAEIGSTEERRLLRQFIDPVNFQEDRSSAGRCWYGYGYMPIFQRNEAFTRAYVKTFRDMLPSHGGISASEAYNPMYPEFVRNLSGDMNHMHRARQRADALGLRYDIYCRAAIDRLMHGKGNKHMPKPNHLGSDKTLIALQAGLDALLDAQARDCLPAGSDPRFRADQYEGHPAQLAALATIERSVRTHVLPGAKLWSFLRDGFISEAEARGRFPSGLVEQALTRGMSMFLDSAAGEGEPHKPACFGYAIDETALVCINCPVRNECGRMVAEVDARQVAVTGTSNPRQEHARTEARKRKRLERYRKTPEGLASAEGVRREICSLIPGLDRKWLPNPEVVRLLGLEGCHGP